MKPSLKLVEKEKTMVRTISVSIYVNPKTGDCEVNPGTLEDLHTGDIVIWSALEASNGIQIAFADESVFATAGFEVGPGESVEMTVQGNLEPGTQQDYSIICNLTGKQVPGDGGGEPTIIIGG